MAFRRMLGCLVLGACSAAAWADELEGEPLGLRISLSLDRISSFSDVLARQASVAHPLGSSINPAADDFLREEPFDYTAVVTATNNQAFFGGGGWLNGVSTTGSYRFAQAGSLSATFARTDTLRGDSRTDDSYFLRGNELSLGYAHRLRKGLSLGIGVHLNDAELDAGQDVAVPKGLFGALPPPIPASIPGRRDTESNTFAGDFSVGVLTALDERWTVGLTAGAGWGDTEIEGAFRPASTFGILPSAVPIELQDDIRAQNLRAGVGHRASEQLGLFADVHYLHLEGMDGSAESVRFLAGAEWLPVKVLALRAGASIDTFEQATISTGVGFYGIRGVPLEAAYVYNAFPEVHPELGRAHLLSLSIVLVF